jgi:hypothetical protein
MQQAIFIASLLLAGHHICTWALEKPGWPGFSNWVLMQWQQQQQQPNQQWKQQQPQLMRATLQVADGSMSSVSSKYKQH